MLHDSLFLVAQHVCADRRLRTQGVLVSFADTGALAPHDWEALLPRSRL